jgi:uncharacterized protein YdeI (YjbR/CyaY-like superfamily)
LTEYKPDSRAVWRSWLAGHHASTAGVWLVWRPSRQQITVDEAVREALCFGWIDSTLRRLADGRLALRFTPRRPGSTWSRPNKQRVAELVEAGLMTEAGLRVVEAAKRDGSWTVLDRVDALEVPDDLARALAASPAAEATFAAYPASAKKAALWWIESARRPQTRAKRLAEIIRRATDGQR